MYGGTPTSWQRGIWDSCFENRSESSDTVYFVPRRRLHRSHYHILSYVPGRLHRSHYHSVYLYLEEGLINCIIIVYICTWKKAS